MKRKLLMLAAMVGMCAVGLISCRNRAEFFAGESLSPEKTRELLVSAEETGDSEESTDLSLQEDKAYYYTEGSGSVYHSNASCGYLKNSHNVRSGSLSDVLAKGKERLCSSCAKAQTQGLDPVQDGRTCYYTPGGTVWHYDAGCASLANSENVQSGTVTQAMLDGKTRACARCGD